MIFTCVTREIVMSSTWMSHTSCPTHKRVMSQTSCPTHKRVTSQTSLRHLLHAMLKLLKLTPKKKGPKSQKKDGSKILITHPKKKREQKSHVPNITRNMTYSYVEHVSVT